MRAEIKRAARAGDPATLKTSQARVNHNKEQSSKGRNRHKVNTTEALRHFAMLCNVEGNHGR